MHKSKQMNLLTPTSYAQMGEYKNNNEHSLEDHLKYNSTKFGANLPNNPGKHSFLSKSPKMGTYNAHVGLTPQKIFKYLEHRQICIHQKFQPNPPKGLGEIGFAKCTGGLTD